MFLQIKWSWLFTERRVVPAYGKRMKCRWNKQTVPKQNIEFHHGPSYVKMPDKIGNRIPSLCPWTNPSCNWYIFKSVLFTSKDRKENGDGWTEKLQSHRFKRTCSSEYFYVCGCNKEQKINMCVVQCKTVGENLTFCIVSYGKQSSINKFNAFFK